MAHCALPSRIGIFALLLAPGLLAGCGGGADGRPSPPPTTPGPAPPEPLTKPTGIRLVERGQTYIVWAWDPVEGATGYEADIFPVGVPPGERPAPVGTTEPSILAEGLEPDTRMGIFVRAVRETAGGRARGPWSDYPGEVSTLPRTPLAGDLEIPPAEAGKVAEERIVLTLTSPQGVPLPDTPYRWTSDEHSGWVFPAEGRTNREGVVEAAWIPGFPGQGTLTLTAGQGESRLEVAFGTLSVAPPRPPWASVWVAYDFGRTGATGYSVDLTPLTEPRGTFYGAISVAPPRGGGFYVGLQRGGSRYDRQLQFSAWDFQGVGARVIERGEGAAVCDSFGDEGAGVNCEFNHPWTVGSTYRFEVTWEALDGGSAITGSVTELASGERRFLGVLWSANPYPVTDAAMFSEDFLRTAPTCLAQAVRSAAFRRVRVRTGGSWQPLTEGTLARDRAGDFANPGTPSCANSAARVHPDGLEVVLGGRTAMDPGITRVTIPQ